MSWLLATGGIVVLVTAMVAYTRFHVHEAERRHPPQGRFVDADGVQTHVLVRSEELDGPTIVLLHGLNGVLEDFDGAIVDRLAEQHPVVAVDRPGYGFTERPDPALCELSNQTRWLGAVLDELAVEDVVLVGHSLGGALAAAYALEDPDRVQGMVLLAPYLHPNGAPPDGLLGLPRLPRLRKLLAHVAAVPIGRPLAGWLAGRSFAPEPMPAGYVQLWADRTLRPSQLVTLVEEGRRLEPAIRRYADRYGELEAPTIVLAGDADQLIHAEEQARRFQADAPRAWIRTVEGAGHMLPWTQPVQVLGAVEEIVHLARERTGGNGHRIREVP